MYLKQLFLVVSLSLSIIAVFGKAASGQTRLGLYFTQEEVNIWKQRAASGPYKTTGDAGTNSPGDWTRIGNNATSFLSNPSANRFAGKTTSGCVQLGTGSNSPRPKRTQGEKLRDAGFVYLITGNTSYRDAVGNELLAQAATAGTNWTDSTRWCRGVLGNHEPVFELTMWLGKLLLGYDYIRASLSSSDRTTLDTWFYNAGYFFEEIPSRIAAKRWPNRDQDNYGSSSWPLGSQRGSLYFNGTGVYEWHQAWDNHAARNIRFVGQVAILVNDTFLKNRAKQWFKEYIKYRVWYKNSSNLATAGGYHRSLFNYSSATFPGLGWGYAGLEIGSMITLADVFARNGDTELYDYTTSEGYYGTEGGPKNLKAVIITHLKMMDHTVKRYNLSSTDSLYLIDNVSEGSNWYSIRDTFLAIANNYYRDNYIKSVYTRAASNVPSYPNAPESIGCGLWQGEWCLFPASLFMFGEMEGKVSPYPGTTVSTPLSTPPPPSSSANPIGYWKFDEGTGTVAKDASGTGNHANLINGATWTTGKSGRAVFLDGLNDFVKIATTNFSTSQGTFTAWIKAPFFKSGTQYIFGHTSRPAYGNRIQLYTNDVAGNLDLGLGDSNTRALNIQQLQANTWHHVSLTWSSSTYAAYVNGVQKTKGTYSGLSTLNSYAHIGGVGLDTDPQPWSGAIDEVKVWNRALSSTEVQDEYKSYQSSTPGAPSELVAKPGPQ